MNQWKACCVSFWHFSGKPTSLGCFVVVVVCSVLMIGFPENCQNDTLYRGASKRWCCCRILQFLADTKACHKQGVRCIASWQQKCCWEMTLIRVKKNWEMTKILNSKLPKLPRTPPSWNQVDNLRFFTKERSKNGSKGSRDWAGGKKGKFNVF